MVKRKENLHIAYMENMKGGNGIVERTGSVEYGDYESNAKVIGRLRLKPGVSIGAHTHEGEEEIMTILSGNPQYCDDGTECVLHPGDVAVCLSGHSHWVANSSDEDVEIFVVVNGVEK